MSSAKRSEVLAMSKAKVLESDYAAQWLAAIVDSSDDAIISKDLNGLITSWNAGAQRIFGYEAEEVIGKSVTILMPPEYIDEEQSILARIRSGERVDHYETVRRRKDGALVNISLTVSPVRDAQGNIVGASKIARDITERKKMEQQRELLMAELSHRVKNTLATVLSIERLSFSGAQDAVSASQAFRARIQSLAQVHGRLAESNWVNFSLASLIEDEIAPYLNRERSNASLSGLPVNLTARCGLSLGLAVHELTTNSAKYGALSSPKGNVIVVWHVRDDGALVLEWTERDGPRVTVPQRKGFGRLLLEQALHQEMSSTVTMDFRPEGLTCTIIIPRQEYEAAFI
jgi:PAS domain S-box-containing protein